MSMSEIQSKLKAPKGQYNSFGKYKYRSCEDIVEAVKPVLAGYGYHLNMSDEVQLVGDRVYVKAFCAVMDGEKVIASSTAYAREPESKKGMDESQITGTASSYARKYALNGLFAIDDTKDADTDEHHNHVNRRPEKPKPVLDESVVAQFESCSTVDELKDVWESLTNEQRQIYADTKNKTKARLS